MATESTKTGNDNKSEKADAVPKEHDENDENAAAREEEAGEKAAARTEGADVKGSGADDDSRRLAKDDASVADADGEDDGDVSEADAAAATSRSSGGRGWGAGAGAVVSAGLGLASLTGTSLSEMLRERKQLIGQIESNPQTGGGGDQINALYGAPWHAASMINGIFALVAVLVGGLLLAGLTGRSDARGWVKAVALAGVVLGVIGLIVAGGMYFDLFASAPEMPTAPSGGAPGGAQ